MYQLFISDFNETRISSTDFQKISNNKFYQNPPSRSQVVSCGQTDMMKLIVAFRNYANPPKMTLVSFGRDQSVQQCFPYLVGAS